jgi:hypothetical protein
LNLPSSSALIFRTLRPCLLLTDFVTGADRINKTFATF